MKRNKVDLFQKEKLQETVVCYCVPFFSNTRPTMLSGVGGAG